MYSSNPSNQHPSQNQINHTTTTTTLNKTTLQTPSPSSASELSTTSPHLVLTSNLQTNPIQPFQHHLLNKLNHQPSHNLQSNPHLPPLDHRLDIAPSPSPPPHLFPTLFSHHLLYQQQQQQQLPQLPSPQPLPLTNHSTTFSTNLDTNPFTTITSTSPTLLPPFLYHPHISPDLYEPQPLDMRPPPPPKKRDRILTDQSGSDSTRPLNTKRPTKKEKPAPVTMVYRGVPDDLLIRPSNRAEITASMTALPPQTAINRGQGQFVSSYHIIICPFHRRYDHPSRIPFFSNLLRR